VDEQSIAGAYLRYHERKREEDRWAVDEIDALVAGDPDTAWEVTRALLGQARSDEELAYIAAGPLEDLLKTHGPRVIDRIERECRNDERLQLALSGVWVRPDDPVFGRWYALMRQYGFAEGGRTAL